MRKEWAARADVLRNRAVLAAILLAGLTVVFAGVSRAGGSGRAAASQAGTTPAYHVTHTYKIGGDTFWDYMAADAAHRHLFVSHGDHVVVMNVDTGAVIGSIPNTQGVHGIAVADDLNRGFISDGGANQVTIFNLTTLKTIGTVKVTGRGPDCIIYDPASQRVFTFNGGSDNSTAIDAKTGKVVGTIALGGRPEYAVADGRGHVYNNLEDKSEQVAIDSHTLKIIKRWPLAPGEGPSGLAMDTEHHRLITGCHNNMMAIVDPDAGKVVATVPIGPGVDACRFDPGTQLAFCSSGGEGGTLTVAHEVSPDKFTLVGHVKTEAGARTMALDLTTHHVFVDTATFGPMPAGARRGAPSARGARGARGRGGFRRPPMVPGSFRVLELVP
jgi:DNA-binding beta-propeller fold protein YncE